MKRKDSDKHPRLLGTGMRYGAGHLSGGRVPGTAPLPSAHPWQGGQDIQGTQLRNGQDVGGASVGGKGVEGPQGRPLCCVNEAHPVLKGQY